MSLSHRVSIPFFALAAAACTAASTPDAAREEHESTSTLLAGGSLASSAPADEEDWSVPTEPFTDPQRNFDEVKKTLLEGYYDASITEQDLYRAAVAGMLERVDPTMHKWNKLLSPSDLAELQRDLQGEVVGIGVQIRLDSASGYIDVLGAIPGSPAERAGIAPPDKIVTVDGKLYKGLTLRDCVADIRGKPGDTVTLSVLRGDKLVSIPVVREKVAYDQVTTLTLEGSIGYVRIPSFNAKTADSLKQALGELSSKKVRAAVVDLRHNPGGSFDAAIASAGELLPAGATVVQLKKRAGSEPMKATTTPVLYGIPIAVLVDHETSSGGELVAAALEEQAHATLVGARTYGKWTVQTISDLPNGYAAKYTLGLFQSPGGKSFQGVGMPPDVEVDVADDAVAGLWGITDPTARLAADVQLRTAVSLLRRGS
jgi:carboxyl-terminal processing protease